MSAPSDSLAQLRRQRTLVAEHLAWLDQQIAAAAGETKPHSTLPTPSALNSPTPIETTSSTVPPGSLPRTDALFDEYRVSTTDLHRDVRRGCFLYFGAALVLLGGLVTLLYLVFRR